LLFKGRFPTQYIKAAWVGREPLNSNLFSIKSTIFSVHLLADLRAMLYTEVVTRADNSCAPGGEIVPIAEARINEAEGVCLTDCG
jgi:hypothetical protein